MKSKTLAYLLCIIILLTALLLTGCNLTAPSNTPSPQKQTTDTVVKTTPKPPTPAVEKKEQKEAPVLKETPVEQKTTKPKADTKSEKQVPPVPKKTETPTPPKKEDLTCSLVIRCDSILKNMDRLDSAKADLVPKDGIIFQAEKVVFYEGESVFNVILRETKKSKIHFEFTNTPIYKSAYLEGIGNLYEFDCGELSGWMYSVNGVFPNYGCSRYLLKDGDKINVLYTCDLGKDIGGRNDLSGE